jgi:hypothetical protein
MFLLGILQSLIAIYGVVQKGDQEYGDTVLRAETNNLLAALQFRAK